MVTKKQITGIVLSIILTTLPSSTIYADRESDVRNEQAWTSQQLNATYARIDELWAAKQQLESEIDSLNASLVDLMVSIDVLKNDISKKEIDIIHTKQNLKKAQKARDKQYESMKKRIQYLYEKGGNDAWFQMILSSKNIGDLLTRAEYTQKMYDHDRKSLEKYVKTIEEVKKLKERYETEQAELKEMKTAYEEQSIVLQNEIDTRKASSANCDAEIAYAQQQATEYANLIAEQQAEIERLEAERIAAEEAARIMAEQAAAQEEYESQIESQEVQYDEAGNIVEDTGNCDDYPSEVYDDVEYDEYGNIIDSDNTIAVEDYESQDILNYSGSGSSVVDYATQFVGNPYVWGGTSLTNGADCSGFTQSVYANFGVDIPRTSYEQQNAGYEVPYSEAQAGDLICYGGHVAIYMGNGQIVHASNSRDGIKISDNAAYQTILSVRRLV